MKNKVLAFLSGLVFGAVAVVVTGLVVCEYVEGLPDDKASEDYDD